MYLWAYILLLYSLLIYIASYLPLIFASVHFRVRYHYTPFMDSWWSPIGNLNGPSVCLSNGGDCRSRIPNVLKREIKQEMGSLMLGYVEFRE